METEELIKLVDGIYKNILDKFNPGARQMINAGKAYLKALHGAAAASRLYVDAISKLARQAQQGTWGGSSDIGAALMKIVEVYKEIQDQQMNILKAFYVDLLVPLETNLEKDTKVVQSEQKRFLQQHKQRAETYSKAAAMMKKQRKKSRSSTKTGLAMDKELKNMQVLEEEKTKLDAFCEQSLKNAMTQERRRYGFVLERQCSLAKHHLSYHSQGVSAYQQNIEKWSEVAKTREFLPDSVENIFTNRLRNISMWQDEDVYSNPRSPNFEDDRMSITSQLRKTKSMDASCLDIRSIGDVGSPVTTMSRAKSEYNLNSSNNSLTQDGHSQPRRPKSMAVPPPPQWDTQLARALYAYLSSGENQLSFLEGDLISLIGERNKGWQFGENLRTQCSGWFPLAYTEILDEPSLSPSHRNETGMSQGQTGVSNNGQNNPGSHDGSETPSGNNTLESSTSRMFGDTIHLHRSSNNAKQIRRAIGSNNIPPPQLPAPVPTPSLPYQKTGLTQSQSTNFTSSLTKPTIDTSTFQSNYSQSGIKSSASSFNFQTQSSISGAYSTHPQPSRSDRPTAGANLPLHLQTKGGKIGGPVGNVSLHSSNDSGFSNDPPPQPEIDYSDDESIPGQTKLTNRSKREKQPQNDKNNNTLVRGSSIRHSQSHGSLVGNQYHMANDPETLTREHKHLVKRTKSFWKFGKNNSDCEILEGMALWRHRDLVDVEESKVKTKKFKSPKKNERAPRDRSNDSDKTINNKNVEEVGSKSKMKKNSANVKPDKKSKMSLSSRKESSMGNNDYDRYNETDVKNAENQFYDDEDGLMLKTVNRRNILQQYDNDDSTIMDSEESHSDASSDDPYDCIVGESQNMDRRQGGNFPNVAEIGKKLEKLSKSSKYSPKKGNNKENHQDQTSVTEKNKLNAKDRTNNNGFDNEIIQYPDKRSSFRTFRGKPDREQQNAPGKYHPNRQGHEERNAENDKRRYYASTDSNRNNATTDRRTGGRPSYESIESDVTELNGRGQDPKTNTNRRSKGESEKSERSKYYDSNVESDEERQFLPRTKLSKTNSNGGRYEQNDLMGYGETLQRRLKNPEYGSKYDDRSPHNGNMYGPWYDLWGLDATSGK
ncbi:GATA zinc finger domain-containing protein 14 isoform X2 [Coccinella septempunctata]|uniref:GATA zinc finger domain-containing protein 14 isoform X2 n=1 Tax=Coccinella septempunctata TaxID=41139 RepID=UPI001D089B4C|nr:GATA zinc finger domain-containing protein 14 isoform X2 [Coccinella septempunctata]